MGLEVILVWLSGQGALISLLVDFAKRNKWVAAHPLLVAAAFNAIITIVTAAFVGVQPDSLAAILKILAAIAVSFGQSVATHKAIDAVTGRP